MEKKITMKERFNELKNIVAGAELEETYAQELQEFLDKQIEKIDKKAEKAAETRAKKVAENDALLEAVFAVVTTELQTGDQIAAQVEGEGITVAKVRNRLSKLVAAERIYKEQMKDAEGKKKMAYAIKATEAEVDTEVDTDDEVAEVEE